MTSGRPWLPLSHLAGLGLFALLALWGFYGHPQPIHLMMAVVGVLVVVAIWEWGSFHGGWQERGVPIPQSLADRAQRKMDEQKTKDGNHVA